jgi:NAD(P)-dependent dehydrogenase (short-subunit alcohol dehydrogenase family)
MQISGAVALVTGANRGLGAAFAQALLDRGAAKVYAGARDVSTITDPRLHPLPLDVTDADSIATAVQAAGDVSIVVNNAGVAGVVSVLGADAELRRQMDVNYFGLVDVSRAFAPVLAANGGGAIVNVLSDVSWRGSTFLGAYAATKAAAWSATNSTRLELADQGTLVVGVHAGYIDTDLTAGLDVPKLAPSEVAGDTLDAVEKGGHEVVVGQIAQDAKASLAKPVTESYPELLAGR